MGYPLEHSLVGLSISIDLYNRISVLGGPVGEGGREGGREGGGGGREGGREVREGGREGGRGGREGGEGGREGGREGRGGRKIEVRIMDRSRMEGGEEERSGRMRRNEKIIIQQNFTGRRV